MCIYIYIYIHTYIHMYTHVHEARTFVGPRSAPFQIAAFFIQTCYP